LDLSSLPMLCTKNLSGQSSPNLCSGWQAFWLNGKRWDVSFFPFEIWKYKPPVSCSLTGVKSYLLGFLFHLLGIGYNLLYHHMNVCLDGSSGIPSRFWNLVEAFWNFLFCYAWDSLVPCVDAVFDEVIDQLSSITVSKLRLSNSYVVAKILLISSIEIKPGACTIVLWLVLLTGISQITWSFGLDCWTCWLSFLFCILHIHFLEVNDLVGNEAIRWLINKSNYCNCEVIIILFTTFKIASLLFQI